MNFFFALFPYEHTIRDNVPRHGGGGVTNPTPQKDRDLNADYKVFERGGPIDCYFPSSHPSIPLTTENHSPPVIFLLDFIRVYAYESLLPAFTLIRTYIYLFIIYIGLNGEYRFVHTCVCACVAR